MTEYDPLLTMSALNMAIVSLHRITSTRDRLILDREYKNIINNIRMGEINADSELTSLYQEIVRVIHRGRLRDNERKQIEDNFSMQKQKGIKEIISGNVFPNLSTSPLEWLVKLAVSCVSEYFSSKVRSEINYADETLRLNSEELDEYDELQRKLLDSSWKLLRQYKLPDSYRLTQNALDKFYSAVQESDPSKRLRMLRYIEGDFAMYSPYWFYRMKSAQESHDNEEGMKSFGRFNEVWRAVLRKDPYKVEALKYKIDVILQTGLNSENVRKIHECLTEIRENAELEDWPNNIYMGMMYFALGRRMAADCLMCNIDFGYETEISRNVLSYCSEKNNLPQKTEALPKSEEIKPVNAEPEVQKVIVPEHENTPVKPLPAVTHTDDDSDDEIKTQMENYYYDKVEPVMNTCVWLGGIGSIILLLILIAFGMNVMLAVVIISIYVFSAYTVNVQRKEFYISGVPDAMYEIGKSYIRKNDVSEGVWWFRYAALRGNIEAQRQLSEIYRPHNGTEAYMWAYLVYLAYLCDGVAIKPSPKEYGLNVSEAAAAEAEAQKIYDNIVQRRQKA
ncbi:MAG: hypothetical protein II884_05180 [Synergistaceae bacterium]|nr:hypothetical protein [Synergistaceae bacterium]